MVVVWEKGASKGKVTDEFRSQHVCKFQLYRDTINQSRLYYCQFIDKFLLIFVIYLVIIVTTK